MAVWYEHIDLSKVWNHDEDWKIVRDNVIPILKDSNWYKRKSMVRAIVTDLEKAECVEIFDDAWHDLYDEADADRVWIGTF